jgi:hypothetical protein
MCVWVWTEKIDGSSDEKAEKGNGDKKPRKKRNVKRKAKGKENQQPWQYPGTKAMWRSEKIVLCRQKPRESADKGGESRTPAMRDGDGEIGNKLRGRNEAREAMHSKNRISEMWHSVASIEVINTNPGTKDLAREMQRIRINDSGNAENRTCFIKPSETRVGREHILLGLV